MTVAHMNVTHVEGLYYIHMTITHMLKVYITYI